MPSDYVPMFELGITNGNPAVKTTGNKQIDPVTLAALVTALFETVMRNVPESKQLQFEAAFTKSLNVIMRERHKCDITLRFPNDE